MLLLHCKTYTRLQQDIDLNGMENDTMTDYIRHSIVMYLKVTTKSFTPQDMVLRGGPTRTAVHCALESARPGSTSPIGPVYLSVKCTCVQMSMENICVNASAIMNGMVSPIHNYVYIIYA